jgi:hypothetical protein
MAYSKEQRAEYQREYRKRQRREQVMNTTMPARVVSDLIDCQDEVARLKRELAARPKVVTPVEHRDSPAPHPVLAAMGLDAEGNPPGVRFGAPRPAPKTGKAKR